MIIKTKKKRKKEDKTMMILIMIIKDETKNITVSFTNKKSHLIWVFFFVCVLNARLRFSLYEDSLSGGNFFR